MVDRFYIVTSQVIPNYIQYGDEKIPLTRENLDKCVAEQKENPMCGLIVIPPNIEELYQK